MMKNKYNSHFWYSYLMAIISGITGNIISAIMFIMVAMANREAKFLYNPQKTKLYKTACVIETVFIAIVIFLILK